MNIGIKSIGSVAILLVWAALIGCMATSCSNNEDDELKSGYGYVQFKLLKSASYQAETSSGSRATVDKLSYLSDACKIEVIMQHDGSTISQALVLNSYNAENAEFGLRSDKLQLLAGDYVVIGYNLYDNLDQLLYTGTITTNNSFHVTENGLEVFDILVSSMERGMVSFKLIKNFVSRAGGDISAYPLSKIKTIDLRVKNLFTQEITTIKKIPVSYKEDFHDNGTPGSNPATSYSECDTVVWLKAGTYQVSSYTSYNDKNGRIPLETALITSEAFTVKDNALTKDVEVPINLSETSDVIKDYMALKEIWDAMDGKNWSYYGEASTIGCNWDFNKDIDMWGDQPGVSLDDHGRVTTLSLTGFGAKGIVPAAIGQLTELQILSLGTHDEKVGANSLQKSLKANMTEAEKEKLRWDYDTHFLAKDAREGLSKELKDAINSDSNMRPIRNSRINLKSDVASGVLTNGITGISRAVMRLTNLQQFYIANSPITDDFWKEVDASSEFYSEKDSWNWSNMTHLTDVEIYNCPKLTKLPVEMLSELPELVSVNIAHNTAVSAAQLKTDWETIADGVAGPKIQLLYMGYNNLEEFPAYEKLNKMVKLSLLDCQYNKLKTLHPFGKEVHLVKCYLDHNEITSIPRAADGYFFGYNSESESFTCSYNKLTLLPNIFNASSVYALSSVDFSYNSIEGFEDGDMHKGLNASSVDLSYNKLSTFPAVLFSKGSPISSLVLAGNGMTEIPKGSMTGKKSSYLTVLDLSYNKLSSVPEDFLPENIPYLYGLDLSYNCFSNFPYTPLNIDHLNVFNVRHQRDSKGNRILKTWPTGLYVCPSLVRFFIGSNDLRKIEDSFSSRLQVLEIADNPNISIDLSTLAARIAAGKMLLIYDETQDVRGLN